MISTRSAALVIDTVVCLTLAKWETVSGRFGGYLNLPFCARTPSKRAALPSPAPGATAVTQACPRVFDKTAFGPTSPLRRTNFLNRDCFTNVMTVLRRGSNIAAWKTVTSANATPSLVVCRYRGAPSRHGGASEAARTSAPILLGQPRRPIETAEEAWRATSCKNSPRFH